jgi:RND family efflux transporter MFP subunit
MKITKNSALFLLAVIIISASSCSSSSDKATSSEKATPIDVRVEMPSLSNDNTISVTGQVESVNTAQISTRVMGYITAIKVKPGDRVSKGQLLVTISNDDVLAKIAQADAMLANATANFESAEKDYKRFTNLYQQKSASAKELDNVTLQYQATKAGVRTAKQMKAEANAMLSYTNITAPFSGVVAKKLSDAGSMASPGMPILVIEQSGNLQVSAAIPETEISTIQLKSTASIAVQSIGKTFTGQVTEISPSSIGSGGQFLVKISLSGEAQKLLNAGMYAHVKIKKIGQSTATSNNETITIPLSAISHVGQLDAIYTVSTEGTALLRYVKLGKAYGDKVEILSGLNSSEGFITEAKGKLYNGVPVKVSKN